jgi:hypothetical protein
MAKNARPIAKFAGELRSRARRGSGGSTKTNEHTMVATSHETIAAHRARGRRRLVLGVVERLVLGVVERLVLGVVERLVRVVVDGACSASSNGVSIAGHGALVLAR